MSSIVEVDHLYKEYRLGQIAGIRGTAARAFGKLSGRPVKERERFYALQDINLHISSGEVVGIIGSNGAGKSTLLKHLANITQPTSGSVSVHGSVAPLIEVGAGINPELTGRENIFLNSAILGIPKARTREQLDGIIEFAEIEQFIDTPVKRYSSGMQVRLGFAIATSMDADLLIVDEVLAVGDIAFQRKCFDRMEELIKRQGKTVILVSHNLRQVERLCSRVVLLDRGQVVADDDARTVCNLFYQRSDEKIKQSVARQGANNQLGGDADQIQVLGVKLVDAEGVATDQVDYDGTTRIAIDLRIRAATDNLIVGLGVHTTDLLYLASTDTEGEFSPGTLEPGDYRMHARVQHFPFLPGVYSFRLAVSHGSPPSMAYYAENLCPVTVGFADGQSRARNGEFGFVPLPTEWALSQVDQDQD